MEPVTPACEHTKAKLPPRLIERYAAKLQRDGFCVIRQQIVPSAVCDECNTIVNARAEGSPMLLEWLRQKPLPKKKGKVCKNIPALLLII